MADVEEVERRIDRAIAAPIAVSHDPALVASCHTTWVR